MENKKVALVVAAAMVMVLISTFTPLAVAADDQAGLSDGGNGDLIAVESMSHSNGGKGDSIAADSVNWVSSKRKTLRSRLFLPQGYLPDSGLVGCQPFDAPCDTLYGYLCCGSCTCEGGDFWHSNRCAGSC